MASMQMRHITSQMIIKVNMVGILSVLDPATFADSEQSLEF